MQPIINKIKRTARLADILAGSPQMFTLTLSLLPSKTQEDKNIVLDKLRSKMDEEENRLTRKIEEDAAAGEGLRPQIQAKVSSMSFQQVKEELIKADEPGARWDSPEMFEEMAKKIFGDGASEADLREELVNQKVDEMIDKRNGAGAGPDAELKALGKEINKIYEMENDTMVGVKFNGPEDILAKLSASMNNDFLDYIKSVANRKKPFDCTNDVAYISLSGIKFLNKIKNSAGDIVAQMPKSGGYKLTNPYVFDQDDFYVDEELPFMELTFQTSL